MDEMKRLMPAMIVFLAGLLSATGIALLAGPVTAQVLPFRIFPEMQRGFPSYIRNAPTYIDARVLAANVSETHAVPTGANTVLFSANCAAYYVKTGASAAVPAGDVTDGTASELNPASWNVGTATQITLIAPAACTITLTWHTIS